MGGRATLRLTVALLGRYELQRLLGTGGAGEVFLAADRARGHAPVVLKRIRANVDERLRAAFAREFSVMASLSVPGVGEVYDFGVAEANEGFGGGPFFTRSYIAGRPLDGAVGQDPLEARLQLFLQVCEIISPLHRVGVCHGDIKPGNIIVSPNRSVHVIDFGLARVLGRSGTPSLGGTLPYMAPETLLGQPTTHAADVYALGTMLWQLITGHLPFGEYGDRAVKAKQSGQVPCAPPGLHGLALQALEVAKRALCYDPLNRFPAVSELREVLGTLLPAAGYQRGTLAFAPPRPRGHETLLTRLEEKVVRSATAGGEGRLLVLVGGQGYGKTLLLRELRWRLQLRNIQVLDLRVPEGTGQAPRTWLLQQLTLLADMSSERSGDEQATDQERPTADRFAELVGRLRDRGPVVVLLDDMDRTERVVGEVLRSALFDERAEQAVLLATTADPKAPPVVALAATDQFTMEGLPRDAVSALANDVLGPVDESTKGALYAATHGVPAAVVEALATLSALEGPTAEDVQNLTPGRAGEALARSRLARVESSAAPCLVLLSLVDDVPRAVLQVLSPDDPHLLAELERQGIVVPRSHGLGLADGVLGKTVQQDLGPVALQQQAQAIIAQLPSAALSSIQWAHLAAAAKNIPLLIKVSVDALAELRAAEAHSAAISIQEALLPHLDATSKSTARVMLARDHQALGHHTVAAEIAQALAEDTSVQAAVQADAALVAARALTASADYSGAIAVLERTAGGGLAEHRAAMQRELARVHMRQGDYDAVLAAANEGLPLIAQDDPARVELLCAKGMVAGYRDETEQAQVCYNEALAIAQSAQSPRDEAKVQSYMAIGQVRQGNMAEARELLSAALNNARTIGDLAFMANASLNLGSVMFHLGDVVGAEQHYEQAARLARRLGSAGTDLQARNNLAHAHVYLGLYERARVEVAQVTREAEASGHRYLQAQAQAVWGDLHSRTGDMDRALIAYDNAISRYNALGQPREMAEHHLDVAEALLHRGGPADGSAAAARISTARALIQTTPTDTLVLRKDLLTLQVRAANAEIHTVLPELEALLLRTKQLHLKELQWSTLATMGQVQCSLGAEFAAATCLRQAVEILEEQAVHLPQEYRDAFWQDPRRRLVRAELSRLSGSSHRFHNDTEQTGLQGDPRLSRLLEIIKRLVAEQDLDRLLERIVDSAVELSGAERGFVLLVDERQHLTLHTARGQCGAEDDQSVLFSRSIAEAVLIDGEPIVSVDASHDGRLSEYVSVHKLLLRSIACLPIRSPERSVGVLYLEHRRCRGCFSEIVVSLLNAFADQAAIALTNARLIAENAQRQAELSAANEELAEAKRALEDALSARTEELQEARSELSRVSPARTDAQRYHMVGSGPAMGKVFAAIDRLKDAAVPVVISGASGTGKELVARAIHYGGIRQQAPFVALNCASLPENLLESELFGHVRGAFTSADRDKTGLIRRAHGGTLFLDEVADMPPKMQVTLLRVLQEGTVRRIGGDTDERVSVRFIAASQHNLKALVEKGQFREDLYYRLNVVEIQLPSLHERREDIPALCVHLLRVIARRDGLPSKRLSAAALRRLVAQDLPGNVRQLEHILLQAALMTTSTTIGPDDLELNVKESQSSQAAPANGTSEAAPVVESEAQRPLAGNVEEFRELEKRRILEALEATGWNRARAAQSLGMARRTFYRRLQDYSIL